MNEVKTKFLQVGYNLLDYTKHPILHLTDGEGLHLRSRPFVMRLLGQPGGNVGMKIRVKVVARDANGKITGVRYHDMSTIGLAQFIQAQIWGYVTGTIKDTGGTGRTVTAYSTVSAQQIVAGTGTTAATFADNVLQAQSASTSGYVSATMNAISGSTFTITGTITNGSGSTINYAEIGLYVTMNTWIFMLAHDVFTALPVSATGTLGVTYTATFS